MSVTDLIDQQLLTFDKDGYKARRVFLVDGVTGSTHEKLFNALNDGSIPDFGDQHPSISTISVVDITARPISSTQYEIDVSYRDPSIDGVNSGSSNATVRASATTAAEEIKKDINGDRFYTTWFSGASIKTQAFTAEIEKPRVTFDFEYTESSFPQSTIDTYLGKINSVIWNGYAVETILCTSINVDEQGEEFKVRISLAYNPNTWAFLASVSDSNLPLSPHPTTPDADLDLTTGIRPFDIYETVDFTPLALTL